MTWFCSQFFSFLVFIKMSAKPAPVFVSNAPQPAKKTTKKPKFVNSKKASPYNRLNVAGSGNKYRYLRFRFSSPNYADANKIIDDLYNEGVVDWSYVTAQYYQTSDAGGGKEYVAVHGILRITDYNAYDWKWFRARWAHAFFRYGYYPENSYPKVQQEAQVSVETQKVGAPSANYSSFCGADVTVTVDEEGSV